MSYKGQGLDLRRPVDWSGRRPTSVSQPVSSSAGWLSRALDDAGPGEPVWVDDTVLRCFNQAHDLAVAHKAAEVGLAHLIHALTLSSAATGTLQQYNFQISALRRDSAAAIATEPALEQAMPGRPSAPSDDLIELLEFAAERAYAQRSPVTTEDLLDTLLDMKRDMTSRNLLTRHRHDWDLRTNGETRERVRVSAGSHQMPRPETIPSQTDTVQNTRIDALERAVRELAEDLALNRKTFSALTEELRQARSSEAGGVSGEGLYVSGGNGPTPPYPEAGSDTFELDHDHIIDRLYLIERNVDAKFGELARTWSVLGERLDAMERTLAETPGTGPTLTQDVVDRLSGLPERLSHLESQVIETIDGKLASNADNLTALPERLSVMEQRILASAGNRSVPDEIVAKLDTIGTAFSSLTRQVEALDERIAQSEGGSVDIAPVSAGIKDIEARTGDALLMIDSVDDRVKKLEDILEGHRAQITQVSSTIGSELKALSSSVSAQSAGGERVNRLIEDGLRSVSQTVERQKGDIAGSVSELMAERLAHITATLQARQTEHNQMLSALSARISDLQTASRDGSPEPDNRLLSMAENYERDSQVTHEAMRAINANQQTLAQTLDQWRSEAKEDAEVLNARLAHLEERGAAAAEGGEDPDESKSRAAELQGTVPPRQLDGWSRFRIWLYGTNDWYGASWRHSEPTESGADRSSGEDTPDHDAYRNTPDAYARS